MNAVNMTPCANPGLCGVQSHRPGTQAPCMKGKAGSGSSSSINRLAQTPVRLQTPSAPSRNPIVHLEPKPPKTGFGGVIKDVLSGLIEGNSKFAGWMADSFMGRDTTQNTGSPFWDGVANSTFAGRVFSATVDDMFAASDRRKAKKLEDRNMQ